MSKRYTHYFDVRLANSFESDIEDFEDAFDHWCATQFQTSLDLRKALLDSNEGIKSILEGILHSDTCENDDNDLSAPAPAGDTNG